MIRCVSPSIDHSYENDWPKQSNQYSIKYVQLLSPKSKGKPFIKNMMAWGNWGTEQELCERVERSTKIWCWNDKNAIIIVEHPEQQQHNNDKPQQRQCTQYTPLILTINHCDIFLIDPKTTWRMDLEFFFLSASRASFGVQYFVGVPKDGANQ